MIDDNNHEQPRVLGQEALQRATAQEEPGRREEVAGTQYYRNDFISNQRSNTHRIATDGRNAGLVNNNVLCYANAIFQIIASCGCLNESLSNPPNIAHQHFSLYFNFARVISSMIRGGNEAVDPVIFTNVFSECVPQFNNKQHNYLL
jgi:ubiquitin C-terminal hydrolase